MDEVHEPVWLEVATEQVDWVVDVAFLRSHWTCTWGRGCLGILDEPAEQLGQGCCSVGAQVEDEGEAQTLAALAALLDPALFEHHAAAAEGGVFADGERSATRVVDGACIFLNRPGFPGGAGCALHLGAVVDGEPPMDWKPSVCWRLPIRVDVEPLPEGRERAVLRRWARRDWGEGGAAMAWCCTEGERSYVGEEPVVESLAAELEAVVGAEAWVRIRARARGGPPADDAYPGPKGRPGARMHERDHEQVEGGRAAPSRRPPRLHEILDALIDHVAIGAPVRSASGEIEDFVLEYMNAPSVDGAGRSAADLVGRRVCELYPEWRASGLFDRFRSVVETGVPWSEDRLPYDGVTSDGVEIHGYWSLRVVPFGDGYLAASRDITDAVAEEQAHRLAQQEADANRLAVELLQRAALPDRLPEVPGLEVGARYVPAGVGRPVGGDWFDLFSLGGDRVGLVIADVAGHGEDAAALMVQVRNYVRALAVEHGEPGAVLTSANRVLSALDETALFATCLYGVIDVSARTFSWATAGHLPPLRIGATPSLLEAPAGPPLGVQGAASFPEAEALLSPGDRILLYTDGLVEQRREPLDASLQALVERASTWRGFGAKQTADAAAAAAPAGDDDLAVVCARLLA